MKRWKSLLPRPRSPLRRTFAKEPIGAKIENEEEAMAKEAFAAEDEEMAEDLIPEEALEGDPDEAEWMEEEEELLAEEEEFEDTQAPMTNPLGEELQAPAPAD